MYINVSVESVQHHKDTTAEAMLALALACRGVDDIYLGRHAKHSGDAADQKWDTRKGCPHAAASLSL